MQEDSESTVILVYGVSSRLLWATCLVSAALPRKKEKRQKQGEKCSPLTISEHTLPNSSKKASVVISPLINLIQGPLSPSLIKAFTMVPEGTRFCTSHSVGHNIHRMRNKKWLGHGERGSDCPPPPPQPPVLWHHYGGCRCSWDVWTLTLTSGGCRT